MVDGVKQFGLSVTKTESVFQRTLSLLLRDPRITGAFFLTHPVNKVASFSKAEHRKDSGDKLGYISAWECEEVLRDAEDQGERWRKKRGRIFFFFFFFFFLKFGLSVASVNSSPQNFVGSPPSSNDIVVKPRPARELKM